MDHERITDLRLEYSDRYVIVESDRPELARFRGKVGRVLTINCSGRAIVQFEGVDRTWYDLDLDYLKIVEAPKAAAPAAAAGEKSASAPGKVSANPAPAKGEAYLPSALEIARQSKEKGQDGNSPTPTANEASAREATEKRPEAASGDT